VPDRLAPQTILHSVWPSLAAVAVALLSACTTNERLSKDDYVARLNALCEEYGRKHDVIGEPQNLADLVDKLPRIIQAFEPVVAEMRKLEAPSEIADDAKRLHAVGERQLQVMRGLVRAAQANDLAALEPLVAENQALNREANGLSRRLGATACAGD
jgi:hypothetical protein